MEFQEFPEHNNSQKYQYIIRVLRLAGRQTGQTHARDGPETAQARGRPRESHALGRSPRRPARG